MHEEGVLIGGLRGTNPDGDDPYVLIQLADEDDHQDSELMDSYYVELCGQAASGYGGIKKIEVRSDCCHLVLNEAGRRMLGKDRDVCIAFEAPVTQAAVASSLERLVGRYGVPVTAS